MDCPWAPVLPRSASGPSTSCSAGPGFLGRSGSRPPGEPCAPTRGGCTGSGLSCYPDTTTDTEPEQLFVVSDSPVTESTQAP